MKLDLRPEAVLRRSDARARMYRRRRVLYLTLTLVTVLALGTLL